MKDQKNVLMAAYTRYSSDSRVQKEAEALADNGWQVDVLALKDDSLPNNGRAGNIRVICLNQEKYRGSSKWGYSLSYLFFFFGIMMRATFLHLEKRYRVIHVNNMPDCLVFAFVIPKLFGSKIILDIHDSMPLLYLDKFGGNTKHFLYRMILLQERASASFADKVLTVHDAMRSEVLAADGISTRKIEVVMNFPDTRKLQPSRRSSSHEILQVVYHGTIAERFGFDYVLRELASIRDLQFLLTIIGDGDFSASLKEAIRTNGVENHVVFDNNAYPIDVVGRMIGTFDLGLVTYRMSKATEYMLPVKLFEYLAAGVPALSVTNRAIARYFARDDLFLFDPRAPGSLSTMVTTIIENPGILRIQREKTAHLREKFSWNEQAQKYNEVVTQLLEN